MQRIALFFKCLWFHWVTASPYLTQRSTWPSGIRLWCCYQCPHCGLEWETEEHHI